MWSEAKEAIRNSSESSSIYIGCDSQIFYRNKKIVADYSIVIVLHKDSCHGCKIFHNSFTKETYGDPSKNDGSMENRLMMETQFALDAFYEIKDVIGNRHLEVHLDVNPDPMYKSNKVTSQALGWVRGMGLVAKIKPEAWAATHAADHCVRKKILI